MLMVPLPPDRPTVDTPSTAIMRFIISRARSCCSVRSCSGSISSVAVIWVELTWGMKDTPIFETCMTVNTSRPTAAMSTSGLTRSAPPSSFT